MRYSVKLLEKTSQTPGTYEVPTATIAWGAIILAIIQILPTLLSSYMGGISKKTDIENALLNNKKFEIELLKQSLSLKDAVSRVNSIKLMIDAGLLDDKLGKLSAITNDVKFIPYWPKNDAPAAKDSTKKTKP